MRVDLISKEYPPEVYGGAGVHVAELVTALRSAHDIDVLVRCFGQPRNEREVFSYRVPAELVHANAALGTLGIDLQIAHDVSGADLVHSHTWYANAAGQLAALLHDIPHVVTAHSLEPLRPWKAEQLAGGYRVSRWIEKSAYESADAVIAVSHGMRDDILRCYPNIPQERVTVVYNGVDLTLWKPTYDDAVLTANGIDKDRPSVVFIGRITRQKGLPYLLKAAEQLPPDVQIIICAGAADTEEIYHEVSSAIAQLRAKRSGVLWLTELLSQEERAVILSQATVFVCPSIYEPLGIVNLEAMACAVPVVATATGGIPEVVDDGVTGRLVALEQRKDGTGTPLDPERFVRDLAQTICEVLAHPDLARKMGEAGRLRAEQEFSWHQIARDTAKLYRSLL